MQIDWWTLGLQTINFLVLVWLLKHFLFRPVRRILDQRREAVAKTLAAASTSRAEAEALRQSLETSRDAIADERADILQKAHSEAEAERQAALKAAQAEAESILRQARASLQKERDQTLSDLKKDVVRLAVGIARNVLERTRPSVSATDWLAHLESVLADLPDNERERLEAAMSADGVRPEVVTSAPLSAEDQAQWTSRLSAHLRCSDGISFRTDPDILGGVQLNLPHAVIKLDWARRLEQAEEALLNDAAPH